MRKYEILTPLVVEAGKRAKTGVITLDDVDAADLLASGAIKPVPEIFADPIVDRVVPGDQADALPVLSDKMTVAALTAVAVDEGVTIGAGFTKAEIINAIALKRAADNAGPRQEGLE